jgi:phage terminase Nu1 subunit (DNA packaging protein)
MPRTTLQLEGDAMKVAKAHAERHRLTLGQAVSELVRKAAEQPLVTEERSGLRVLRLGRRSPRVTAARVDQLREDLP